MSSKNADAAADEFNRGALIDIHLPADPAKERCSKQARNRAADNNRAAAEGSHRGSVLRG
jgi:hypothetical protein